MKGTGEFIWPEKNPIITAKFNGYPGHKGLDMQYTGKYWHKNQPIYAADCGIVITSTYSSSYGNYIEIDHKNGYKTVYAHLSKRNVSKNQTVKKGEIIGNEGTTGYSTGDHLHFEIKKNNVKTDPEKHLPSNKSSWKYGTTSCRKYYAKVKYNMDECRFDPFGHHWYLMEITNTCSVFKDKEMKIRDSARNYKVGEFQVSRPVGLNSKDYFMHEFISKNGNKFYYAYFKK